MKIKNVIIIILTIVTLLLLNTTISMADTKLVPGSPDRQFGFGNGRKQ